MTWHPPSTDATHAMYQPDKRAHGGLSVPTPASPNKEGTQAEKEAWMRQKQARGKIPRRSVRIERTIGAVCALHGVTRAELLGKLRLHNIVAARGQTCRDLRDLGLSSTEVARALNLADHTSVLYHWGKATAKAFKAETKDAESPAITYCEGGISL